MVAIKLHELSKSFQGPVINQLSLTIPDQQITALIGPSGSGKSTLLNMIAGLTTPDSGQISFDNQPIFDAATHWNQPPAQRHLAMVFQDFALWPHMTVQENVAFALEKHLTKPELTAQVNWALEQVSLIDFRHRYPRELSGGQQQRVALARALATQPDLILFDEALSALDPELRTRLQLEIRALIHDQHLTAIFVTHDRPEALQVADHLVLLQGGNVVQTGTPAQLYQQRQNLNLSPILWAPLIRSTRTRPFARNMSQSVKRVLSSPLTKAWCSVQPLWAIILILTFKSAPMIGTSRPSYPIPLHRSH